MKALRLVLITSVCLSLAQIASAQVKIGDNELDITAGRQLEIEQQDSFLIVTDGLEFGLIDSRAGNATTDALMIKLFGYGLEQFFPSAISAVQDNTLLNTVTSNVFLGITEDGSIMEVPIRLNLEVERATNTALIGVSNGVDTFGVADLTILDSIFATDIQLRDSVSQIRNNLQLIEARDADTVTGNEFVDSLYITNDTLFLVENRDGNTVATNTQTVDLGPVLGGSTFYLADGSLDESRTVDGATNRLTFENLGDLDISSNDSIVIDAAQHVTINGSDGATGGVSIQSNGQDVIQVNNAEEVKFRSSSVDTSLLIGADGILQAETYGDISPAESSASYTTILGATADGTLIDIDVNDVLAAQEDSTIYTHDGTLTGDRTMTGGGNNLDFTGLGDFTITGDSLIIDGAVRGTDFGSSDGVIPATIIGATSSGNLVDLTIDELLAEQPDSTIYTHDGTLTGDRTLTGGSNNLDFTGLGDFTITGDSLIIDGAVRGTDFGSSDGVIPATIIGATSSGNLVDLTIDELLGEQPDSTIYTHDGTLTGDRTLTGGSNNLDFTGLGDFTITGDSLIIDGAIRGTDFGSSDGVIPATIIGATANGNLVDLTIDELLAEQPDSTIYTHDGTLTGDRTLTGSDNDLIFTDLGAFSVDSDTSITFTTTDTIFLDGEIRGTGFGSDDTETASTIIGAMSDGTLIDVTFDEILGAQEDSTIYTHNGTLTGERTMTMGGNDLLFVNTAGTDTTLITQDGEMVIGGGTFTGGAIAANVKLEVKGNVLAVQVHSSSDRRFKKNITPVESALRKVMNLEGVTYDFRTNEFENRNFPSDRQLGFIAQDIEKYVPEVVTTNGDGYKAVDYAKVTALLVEAIKEQQETINTLENQLAKAETSNASMASEIADIKMMIQQLSNQNVADED